MTLLNVWMIWKLRKECTFNIAQPNIASILNRIKAEARLWASASATGLRVYLPETWDVHWCFLCVVLSLPRHVNTLPSFQWNETQPFCVFSKKKTIIKL
jgi:hypothetical protein